MSTLLDEIDQQPDALERLLHERRAEIKDAAAKIRAFDPAWVVIAARGSSDNAARYAQYVLGAHNRLGVALAVPSLHTIYETPPRYARALAIGISQSGQSPDVVSVIAAAREQGGLTIAITNDPSSPLAQAAEIVLALATGAERSIAATKTYTNQLMLLAMLSAAIAESHEAELETVPGAVAAALEATGELGALALDYATAGRFVVLGRGFNYCTAHELALKMKETSYVLAEPYSSADLRHGPVAMIEYGFPVVLIAPSGRASDDTSELLELLRWRRARVIALSDRDDVLARAAAGIRLPPGVPEWLSPIVTIAPGQRFAHALATAKGLDPDRPRDLTKVTKTR